MSYITIPATDDFPLVATEYAANTNKIVVIACATGIPQSFYAAFAKHLSKVATVITFDYRYTGLSFSDTKANYTLLNDAQKIAILKQHQDVLLHHFGERDIRGVLEYVAKYNKRIYYIGHSLGCHVLPLAGPVLEKIHATMFVSATNPYVEAYTDPKTARYGWKMMEASTDEKGYFDGREYKMGGLLPSAALKMWAAWSRLPGYACDDPEKRDVYAQYKGRVTALGFTDDVQVIKSPRTLDMWNDALNADVKLIMFDSAQHGLNIGHNDVFRARNEQMWTIFTEWIDGKSKL